MFIHVTPPRIVYLITLRHKQALLRRFKKKFGKVAVSTDSDEVNISNINSYDSLSVETGSGDISLTHEAMPDNLSCHISSGSDDVTVQLKNAEFSTDTDGCKDGSIEKGENSLSIMSNSGTVIVK